MAEAGHGRRSHAWTLWPALLGTAAAVATSWVVPGDQLPDALPGTAIRWALAPVVGVTWCLLAASKGDPRAIPHLVRALRRVPTVRVHGWLTVWSRIITEEAVWRGVVLVVFQAAFGLAAALVLASISFGLWHVHQGLRGVVANIINGGVFGLSALLLGGLVAAVLTHVAYNVTVVALLLGRRRGASAGSKP